MTLSAALSNALSGLLTNQRQADVAAHNIANTTTPGYSRREVEVESLVAGGLGQGVRVSAVQRQVDLLLIRDTRLEDARLQFLTTSADAFTRVADALGDTESVNALPQLMTRVEETFRALETTPESGPRQQETLRAIQQLTRGFSELSEEFSRMRSDADAAIQREVNVLNDSLQQLARVNREIVVRSTRGADTSDLEDQRDQLIDEVAKRVPVRVVRGDDEDAVIVMTREGVPLIDHSAQTIEFDHRAIVAATELYDPTGSADPGYSHVLSGLSVNGRDIAPGSGDSQAIDDGMLAGLFRVRDEVTVEALQRLDAVAYAITEQFQDTAVDTSLGVADPGLFTDAGARLDTTDPASVVGFASRIAVNADVDPDQGGDLTRLRDGVAAVAPGFAGETAQLERFIEVFSTVTSFSAASGLSDNTVADGAREFAQLAHQARTATSRDATAQEISFQAITDLRLSRSGVSTDVELQKLTLYERSFAANSQVVQAATRMLDELLGIAV